MSSLNQQLDLLRQSPTVAMADRVNAMKAAGINIIGLQTGDPDFSTPSEIVDVALDAMKKGVTHYGPSRGFIETRRAAAHKLERDNNVSYDPETEILITHGGIHAFYISMQAILNPGDHVLIPDPTWATHANMVTLLRGTPVRVPAPAENGFLPSFEAWENSYTNQTKAIVINYPSNPTGVYPSLAYMQKLQDFAESHNLLVISDEVYENLFYDEHPTSAASIPNAKSRTILIHSLSKTYAMTGWRVGYLAAPSSIINNALKASQNSITCVSPFIQRAAEFALSDAGIQQKTIDMRSIYSKRRAIVMEVAEELKPKNISVIPPQGAFYFFLDCRALKISSHDMCEWILDEVGVGLVAGSAFGQQGEGFLRMTIAASNSDVENGIRKIIEWSNSIKNKGMHK